MGHLTTLTLPMTPRDTVPVTGMVYPAGPCGRVTSKRVSMAYGKGYAGPGNGAL